MDKNNRIEGKMNRRFTFVFNPHLDLTANGKGEMKVIRKGGFGWFSTR